MKIRVQAQRELALVILLAFMLSGCATMKKVFLGAEDPIVPKTPRERVLAVDAGIQIVSTDTSLLLNRRVINTEEAERVHAVLEGAYRVNDQARKALIAGDEVDVMTFLEQAEGLLNSAEAHLRRYKGEE